MTTVGAQRRNGRALVGGLAVLAALGGCGKRERPEAASSAPPPVVRSDTASSTPLPGLSPAQRLDRAVNLLQAGEVTSARVEVVQLLVDQPANSDAAEMLQTIDTDPRALFGGDSFAYTLKRDESLETLARRFLGSPYKFYGLARFNGIAVPNSARAGQTVQVPGRAPEVVPARPRPPRRWWSARPTPVPPASTAGPTPPPVPSGPSAADRARAQRLRRSGLEQMSAGAIGRAVQLLGSAAALDPANSAIAADLARARRIQATVRDR